MVQPPLDQTLIELPMPILTPRLMLRPAQAGDGAAVFEATKESWAELSRWSIWSFRPREESTPAHDEAFCRQRHASFILREKITLLAFDRQTEELVGQGSLNDCDWTLRTFSLGYWVRTGRTGQGYATEIATALINYAFGPMAACKLNSMHAKGNVASQRVLEKVGFQREGILRRQHGLPDRSVVDEYVYGLLKEEAKHG